MNAFQKDFLEWCETTIQSNRGQIAAFKGGMHIGRQIDGRHEDLTSEAQAACERNIAELEALVAKIKSGG